MCTSLEELVLPQLSLPSSSSPLEPGGETPCPFALSLSRDLGEEVRPRREAWPGLSIALLSANKSW